MECFLPLGRRLIDLAHHPLGFLLLPGDLYRDFGASVWDGRFLHTLPALVLMAAVLYRLGRSQRIGTFRHSLRCKMHKNFFYVCNVFCLHWLVNMTLVSFLSLQDFLVCTSHSNCQTLKQDPGFPARLWTKPEPCPVVSTNLSLGVVSGTMILAALVLWKPDILLGYIMHQLRRRHALANWVGEMVFGADNPGDSRVEGQGDREDDTHRNDDEHAAVDASG